MTFPSDKNTAGQADLADIELAHEDQVAGPAGVAYPPLAELPSPATAIGGGIAEDDVADDRWSKIQAMFVDDPRGSIAEAASLVDDAIEAFITAIRERQASLASSWQTLDGDTEQLRAAFREYRAFWNSVTGFSPAP
jgi:hypothetical protein